MMQEIELSPPASEKRDKHVVELAPPPPPLNESDLSRREAYKQIIHNAFCRFQRIDSDTEWTLFPCNAAMVKLDPTERIFKVEKFIDCSAYQAYILLTDHSYVTLSQWSKGSLQLLDSIFCETFDVGEAENPLHIVQSSWKFPGLITKPRNLLGLEWTRYNNIKQTFSVIFQSCLHSIYKCPPDHVPFQGGYSIWIQHMDSTKCFLSMTVDLSYEKGFISPIVINKICENLAQYVCILPTVKFKSIYAKWTCQNCEKENDAHLLECRYCTIARYWKCLQIGCKKSQPATAQNICVYCGAEKE